MTINRREFIKIAGAGATTLALAGCATMSGLGKSRVVVIGGGYGGATAAKYLKLWGGGDIDVVMVERNAQFISCPLSNLVLGGSKSIADLTRSYDGLAKAGVKIVQDEVAAIDPAKRVLTLARGSALAYDRLIVSPGVEFMYDTIPALNNEAAQQIILHAWKAGWETSALRRQLESMRDGGVYAIHIPKAPYRCPPGPYERACQVASYFKQAKPKSKVLILDANEDIVSKKGLFTKAWNELYPGMIEYCNNSELVDVDPASNTAKLAFGDVKADVLNVLPPMRAGEIAKKTGLITANNGWCEIDWLTYESKAHKNIHMLGDAVLAAPAMPKSGHMANAQGKACAAAVLDLLANHEVNPSPMLINTCYSFVSDKQVIHVASVHKYDAAKKTMAAVEGSGGVSAERSELEAAYGQAWAQNIWADMLT
ncbi:MAG: FCSD flavin-binding domain-containing protein [Burkholderiales bacterium]